MKEEKNQQILDIQKEILQTEEIDELQSKWDELQVLKENLQAQSKMLSDEKHIFEVNKIAYEKRYKQFLEDKSALEIDKMELEHNQEYFQHHIKRYNDQLKEVKNRETKLREAENKFEQEKEAFYEKKMQNTITEANNINSTQANYLEALQKEHEKNIAKNLELVQKIHGDLIKERSEALSKLNSDLEKERQRVQEELRLQREEQEKELKNKEFELRSALKEADKEKEAYILKQEELDVKSSLMSARDAEFQNKYDDLEAEIERRCEDKVDTCLQQLDALKDQLECIKEVNEELMQENGTFSSWKEIYGDNPSILKDELAKLKQKNKELAEELQMRPTTSIEEELCTLKESYDDLLQRKVELERINRNYVNEAQDNYEISRDLENSKRKLRNLETEIEELNNIITAKDQQILRLTSVEGAAANREERIKDIKEAYLAGIENPVRDVNQPLDEKEWLDEIGKNCKDYGIAFPKRILYAFHTSLKIADWSTITVLAGVSGTGKSELPRLYATMGRLNFINVSVQPNWDSQESMLGFFNSIDNRFDAQPVLRFLVQCTEELDKCVSIVLLDEMNLAHVEYYFAEFLSKLEQRRGTQKGHEPEIEVKLGAGVQAYKLPLKRNILWCGTMNQDETTKSLSDKVLDRGQVINFPRPRDLKDRVKMENITLFEQERFADRPMLHYSTWRSWIKIEIGFKDDQDKEIKRFKKIIEDINTYLAEVGRALGHRVWQSMEFYIANYPDVIAAQKEASEGELTGELQDAMKTAFEDQLVQKVMPKLRGIDTRGRSKEECLDKIKALLNDEGFDSLIRDFDLACELGYGQFIWSSAEYISAGKKESN